MCVIFIDSICVLPYQAYQRSMHIHSSSLVSLVHLSTRRNLLLFVNVCCAYLSN